MLNDVMTTFCLFISMVKVIYKFYYKCPSSFVTKISNAFLLCLEVVFDGEMSLSITFCLLEDQEVYFLFEPNLAPIANVLSTSFPTRNQPNLFGFWRKSSPLFTRMIAIRTQCCDLSFPSSHV